MKVYIVAPWYEYEGHGAPVVVFSTYEKAKDYAIRRMREEVENNSYERKKKNQANPKVYEKYGFDAEGFKWTDDAAYAYNVGFSFDVFERTLYES